MKKAIKTKWLKALRGEKYQQGQKSLRNSSGQYCCLGVLCDVQSKKALKSLPSMSMSTLPKKWAAGLTTKQMAQLANMNDRGESFWDIAAHVELWT
jgi:hypothetical protein